MESEELILKDEVYAVVGAAMEVHSVLGAGFAEAVYQEAMGLEMQSRTLPFVPQQRLVVRYKQWALQKFYVADFICFGQVLLEVKAEDRIYPRDQAQLLNYLRATGLSVGVILNFGHYAKLEWKRMVATRFGAMDPDEPID